MSVALFDARTPAREPHTPVISMALDVHRAAPHELSDVCAHAGGAFVVCRALVVDAGGARAPADAMGSRPAQLLLPLGKSGFEGSWGQLGGSKWSIVGHLF